MSGHKGFTLIEMMVVVFIIGIMLGVSALAMRSDGFKNLASDGNQLIKQIDLARQESSMRQTRLFLQVDRMGWSFHTRNAIGLEPVAIASLKKKKWSQKVDAISSKLHTLKDEKIILELDAEPVGSPIQITVTSNDNVLEIKNNQQGQLTVSRMN